MDVKPSLSHLFPGYPIDVEVRLLNDEDAVQHKTVDKLDVTIIGEDGKVRHAVGYQEHERTPAHYCSTCGDCERKPRRVLCLLVRFVFLYVQFRMFPDRSPGSWSPLFAGERPSLPERPGLWPAACSGLVPEVFIIYFRRCLKGRAVARVGAPHR